MESGSEITVVVMEHGAPWPECVRSFRRTTPDTVVIAQADDEDPAQLARRVRDRLASLTREGRPVRAGVVAVSRRADSTVFEARTQLARLLLRALNGTSAEGTLWLCGSPALPDAARHHLIALAGTLTSQLGGSGVSIAIRFGASEDARRRDSYVRELEPRSTLRPMANISSA